MSEMYMAVKRSPSVYQFAFGKTSLPTEGDDVVDGNVEGETIDGND